MKNPFEKRNPDENDLSPGAKLHAQRRMIKQAFKQMVEIDFDIETLS